MHTRTYADASVKALAGKFVWVLVDPSRGQANKDLMRDYRDKLRDAFDLDLTLPTAVFMDSSGKILKAAVGMVEPPDFVAILKEVAG